jgi:NAD(P)-dependent dehydrogenase (short-subunit alcohol dehydrogenase family)
MPERIGLPEDMAPAAAYLARGEDAWVTGTNPVVDVGFTVG